MTFVPRSFVFFNGCSGMHPAAQPMRQAFAGAGASVFAGWTNPISDGLSAAVARQLFDLMLAENVYDSVSPPRDLQRFTTPSYTSSSRDGTRKIVPASLGRAVVWSNSRSTGWQVHPRINLPCSCLQSSR
jgi:hypothetical protein